MNSIKRFLNRVADVLEMPLWLLRFAYRLGIWLLWLVVSVVLVPLIVAIWALQFTFRALHGFRLPLLLVCLMGAPFVFWMNSDVGTVQGLNSSLTARPYYPDYVAALGGFIEDMRYLLVFGFGIMLFVMKKDIATQAATPFVTYPAFGWFRKLPPLLPPLGIFSRFDLPEPPQPLPVETLEPQFSEPVYVAEAAPDVPPMTVEQAKADIPPHLRDIVH